MNFSEIFVCEDKECSTFQKNVPSPLFRKSFVLEEEPQSAGIVVGTTGFSILDKYATYKNKRLKEKKKAAEEEKKAIREQMRRNKK